MITLSEFISKVARDEGAPPQRLISAWKSTDKQSIDEALRNAFGNSRIELFVPPGISAAALGNRVEDTVAENLSDLLSKYDLSPCPGVGYPDQILRRSRDG